MDIKEFNSIPGEDKTVEDELYNPQDLANFFRVDAKTIGRWDRDGKFEAAGIQVLTTIGGHRRFLRSEIHELMDRIMANGDNDLIPISRPNKFKNEKNEIKAA